MPLSVRLDQKTESLIGRLARRRQQTKSEVIRNAIGVLAKQQETGAVKTRPYYPGGSSDWQCQRRTSGSFRRCEQEGSKNASRASPQASMILVDAGPLIALIHQDDNQHERCRDAFAALDQQLGTVWPVVTEALHLLNFSWRAQDALWEIIANRRDRNHAVSNRGRPAH